MNDHKHEFVEAGGLVYCECGASPFTRELAWAEKVQGLVVDMRQRADEADARAAGCPELVGSTLRDAAEALRAGADKVTREVLSKARAELPNNPS